MLIGATGGWTRKSVLVGVALVQMAALVYCLVILQPGMPNVARRRGSFLVGQPGVPLRVSQTLTIPAAGFNRFSLLPEEVGHSSAGIATLEVWDLSGTPQLARRGEVALTALLTRESYTFAFDPLESSTGRKYRIDVRVDGIDADGGAGLWASEGSQYAEGALFVGDKEMPADLVFDAAAADATPLARLIRDVRTGRWPLMVVVMLLALIGGIHLILVRLCAMILDS